MVFKTMQMLYKSQNKYVYNKYSVLICWITELTRLHETFMGSYLPTHNYYTKQRKRDKYVAEPTSPCMSKQLFYNSTVLLLTTWSFI